MEPDENKETAIHSPALSPIAGEDDAKTWYYADAQGASVGPMLFRELESLFQQGTISEQTQVYEAGPKGCGWKTLESYRRSQAADQLPGLSPASYSPIPPSTQSVLAQEEEHKFGTPGRVAAGGLGCVGVCLGILGGIGGLIIGIALCCTGIGAIIGIPLLFFVAIGAMTIIGGGSLGILSSVAGNRRTLKAPCPYCGHSEITMNTETLGVDCPACQKRIVIRDKAFMRVE